jgi:hypothetical protein
VASPTTLTPPPELDQRLLERPHHHWRRWVIAAAILVIVAGVAGFILNWYGLLPWRGPMSGPVNEMGGITQMFDVSAGHPVAYTLYISNPSRVAVVLDSVEPASQTPGLVGEDAWFFVSSPRCKRISTRFPYGVTPDCRTPLQGHVLPAHQDAGNGARVIVMLRPTQAGDYRSQAFEIHYHVGPIHYTTTIGDGFRIHAS